jgi:uncharacterized protein YggE
MKRNRNIMTVVVCAVLAALLLAGLAGCGAAPTGDTPAEPAITVAASASVTLVPDKATFTFAVTTQEQTPELAQNKNSEAVKNVMDVLTGRGVEEKSIRTTSYNMYPQYDWSDNEQRLVGYVVMTSMSVQEQDIGDVGKLLAACVDAGANRIDSVVFLCSGYDEAYRQALAKAVDEARSKAETLAAAAGKKLGDAVTVTEGWQDTSAKAGRSVDVPDAVNAAADEAVPVLQPGETEIQANVTVTYRMG